MLVHIYLLLGDGCVFCVVVRPEAIWRESNNNWQFGDFGSSNLADPAWRRVRILSIVALRVVGEDEKRIQCLGIKLDHSVPGDINTGTWPSRLWESRIWDSKMWSWVPRDSDPKMTALARTSSNCKRQTRSLVRDGTPHQQIRNWMLDTKTDWPTDRRS
jgi:hypothetical protein